MGLPVIPERCSSKRKEVETIEELEDQQKKLSKAIRNQSIDYQETIVMMLSVSIFLGLKNRF